MFNVIGGAIDDAVDRIGDAVRHTVASLPGDTASFRVEPDRVHELANRLDAVADRIAGGIAPEVMALMVAAPGGDPPSAIAAGRLTETGFGDAGLITRLNAYVTELRAAASSLRRTAVQYGLTDSTEGGRLSAADL